MPMRVLPMMRPVSGGVDVAGGELVRVINYGILVWKATRGIYAVLASGFVITGLSYRGDFFPPVFTWYYCCC